jgi:hypothetical protein
MLAFRPKNVMVFGPDTEEAAVGRMAKKRRGRIFVDPAEALLGFEMRDFGGAE